MEEPRKPGPGQRARELAGQLLARRPRVRITDLGTWQFTAGATVLGLVLAAVVATLAGPFDSTGQRTAEAARAAARERRGGADHGAHAPGGSPHRPAPAPRAPAVLAALAGQGRALGGPALAAALDPLLADASLGESRSAAVVDVATGKRVYGKSPGRTLTPASTTKLATAVAALSANGADHRIATRALSVRDGAKTRVVLVGGGDPTLTARAKPRGASRGAASLRTLAADTARALAADGVHTVTLGYDTSLYSGPVLHPIGPNENIAPVEALMTDEGRLDDSSSGPATRSADPSGDAARTFAALLRDHGVKVTGDPAAARAGRGATELAAVRSPRLSALVERMLTNSDNDIAEALARQTALATHHPASFAGGRAALHAQLARLELPLTGARFADGSGLDRSDRISASLLTALLAEAAAPAHPELRPVLTGLPVAGFTGTLVSRYADAADAAGTGLVRAKTGTLTGVNTLAGTVVTTDGRLLVFAFMTTGSTDPRATQSALDHLAATLASCGCR